MNTAVNQIKLLLLLLAIGLGITGCQLFRGDEGEATATLDVTQAYQTVNARLTQAVGETPSATMGPSATATSIASRTPTLGTPTATSTPISQIPTNDGSCTNRAAPGVPIDVTIPDDTEMVPGQEFTKTWRLQNAGTCNWTQEYVIAYFSGEPMGADSSLKLSQAVPPGTSVDISVDMVAPLNPGSYQGNWKLRTGTGDWFGIGPNYDAPFWVRITVISQPTAAPTASRGAPTATATPSVLASDSVIMQPGDGLDLDTADLNGGAGDDLDYVQIADNLHQLQVVGSTRLSVYGAAQPSVSDCQSASITASFVNVEAMPPGTYLCYRTGLGWIGRAMVFDFNESDAELTLEILTWSAQ